MNQRLYESTPARPVRKPSRPSRSEFDRPAESNPAPALPRAIFWGESGSMPVVNPAADRPWALATLAMLVVAVLAALGPIISG